MRSTFYQSQSVIPPVPSSHVLSIAFLFQEGEVFVVSSAVPPLSNVNLSDGYRLALTLAPDSHLRGGTYSWMRNDSETENEWGQAY